jgi:hypothetical protein
MTDDAIRAARAVFSTAFETKRVDKPKEYKAALETFDALVRRCADAETVEANAKRRRTATRLACRTAHSAFN